MTEFTKSAIKEYVQCPFFSRLVNMDRVYFVLVRVCARSCFAGHIFHSTPREQWLELVKELHPMNPGRLLSFYYYMDQCNATFTEQYTFHKVLCVTYSMHYPSFWWMVWQIVIKSLRMKKI